MPSEGTVDRLEKHIRGIECRLAALEHAKPISVAGDAINLDDPSPKPRPIDQSRLLEPDPSFTNQSLQASERATMVALSTGTVDDLTINHSLHQL